MGLKLFAAALLWAVLPGLAEAADCVTVQHETIALVRDADCGTLKLKSGMRSGLRPGDTIEATWVEFSAPSGPGEWRYNDWVHQQLAMLDADRPVPASTVAPRADHWAIQSLYRSDRLISARYLGQACCGGESSAVSVNVDLARWTLFSPDEVLSLGASAAACWQQFGKDPSRGQVFASAWPVGRAWQDRDFEGRRFGRVMREIIGADVIDREPSAGRTRRVFIQVLQDQSRWSFTGDGATVDFGELMGSAAGPYVCTLATAQLQALAHPGAAIPP